MVCSAKLVKVFEEANCGRWNIVGKSHRSYSILSIQLSYFRMRNHEKRMKRGYIYIYNYIIYIDIENSLHITLPNGTHKQEN